MTAKKRANCIFAVIFYLHWGTTGAINRALPMAINRVHVHYCYLRRNDGRDQSGPYQWRLIAFMCTIAI